MRNKKIRRIATWIIALSLFITFVNEVRILTLVYRIKTNQSSYADVDGIKHVVNNKTPLTQFVFSSIIQFKYDLGALTDRDFGLICCYLHNGGAAAEANFVRLGAQTLNDRKNLRKELESYKNDLNNTGCILVLITNSLATHYDTAFSSNYRLRDGTAKFLADYMSFEYEEKFRIQTVHFAQPRADQRISIYVIDTLEHLGHLVPKNSAPINHHRLLIEATTMTEIAEKYLSDDAEKEIVRQAMEEFLKKVQERPMSNADLRD